MTGIEIRGDENSPFLDVNLKDILPCLQAPDTMHWHLLYLHIWGLTGIEEYGDHGEKVCHSPEGVSATLQQVQQLAAVPAQIVDLVLLGSADKANLRRYKEEDEMYAACDYVIEVVDSSYLLVHSSDEVFLTCLRHSFASQLGGVRASE